MTQGTYTDHLSEIRILLARLDERQAGTNKRLDKINGTLERHAVRLDDLEDSAQALSTRQKLIMGIGGALGTGVIGTFLKLLFGSW